MRLPLILATLLGALLVGGIATARPTISFNQALWLSGEPSAVGVIVSAAGANTTNASTGTPFAITVANVPTRVITLQADATAFCGFSATCGTTLATSGGCFRLGASDAPKVVTLLDATTAINCAGPAAFNVVVTQLK